jgi:hypothetical protein
MREVNNSWLINIIYNVTFMFKIATGAPVALPCAGAGENQAVLDAADLYLIRHADL